MANKDIQQINRLIDKIKPAIKKHEYPKKDADNTTALSPKTIAHLESVIGKFNQISSDNADIIKKIIEKMLVSEETKILEDNYKKLSAIDSSINEISKGLESLLDGLESIKEKVEGGYGLEALLNYFKGQVGKTISVHLDNADKLERPQPIVVSLGEDFKKMIKVIEKVRTPEIVVKESGDMIKAISKLENRPINLTMPDKSSKKWRFTFVRNENNLAKEIIAEQI